MRENFWGHVRNAPLELLRYNMSISTALATFIILLLLILFQIKVWKYRVLLSPAFYFGILWLFGVTGLLINNSADVIVDTYPEFIDELNILISFTGLCFIAFTKTGRKKITINKIDITKINTWTNYVILCVILFIVAIVIFFTEGNGFDFGKARNSMHETVANRNVLVEYIRLVSAPLSIFAGSIICLLFTAKNNIYKTKYLFLLLPFLSNMLFSLTEGGRVSMVFSLTQYLIGFGLTIPTKWSLLGSKKVIAILLAGFIAINLLISWVGTVRSVSDHNTKHIVIKEELGVFSPLYGITEYVSSSYIGYQFRRIDAVSPELGYGRYTFNGFINWTIPFFSQLGIKNGSIADIFGIYYHNQETYDRKRPYYYVTHSSYIPIIKDYGFRGAFLCIIFLTFITQRLFIKIQMRDNIFVNIQFFWFYLFFEYWVKSNFYGTLSSSIIIPFYGFANPERERD